MTTIAIANQKGGCGKTTTAINLAACLGRHEQRVLLIDMDPQGHASLGLGRRCENVTGLYEVFMGEVALSEVILPEVAAGDHLAGGGGAPPFRSARPGTSTGHAPRRPAD